MNYNYEVYINGKFVNAFKEERDAKKHFWYDSRMGAGDVFEIVFKNKIIFIAEKNNQLDIEIIRGARW